jgi:hypothetical protein
MSAGRLSRVVVTVAAVLSWGAVVGAEPALHSLGEIDIPVLGLTAGIDPADPIVPKETASGLRIVVQTGGQTLSATEVARLLGGSFEVRRGCG